MSDLAEKVKQAIQWIKSFEPEDGYYLAYSGGKDSDTIRILAQLAGVKHEIHHNHTTVDAPETVRYVRSIPGVIVDMPRTSMWQLIVEKGMPPTRLVRYCCAELKECGGYGRLVMTGVRWGESRNRANTAGLVSLFSAKKVMREAENNGVIAKLNQKGGLVLNDDNDESRRFVEKCFRTVKTMVNPIVDWTDNNVWGFLHYYGCESNPLYYCGFKRIGCIGCPMAGKHRYTEFRLYPAYKKLYLHAFTRMLEEREKRGKPNSFGSAKEVFKWWMEEDPYQLSMFDAEEYEEIEEEMLYGR